MHLPQKCPLSFQYHANVANEETKWPAKNSAVRHSASQFLRPMANVANEQHQSPNIKAEVVRGTGFHRRKWILRGGKDSGKIVLPYPIGSQDPFPTAARRYGNVHATPSARAETGGRGEGGR